MGSTNTTYWARTRASRRRVIGTAGALGAGVAAATLVGCGSDGGGGGTTRQDARGLISGREDTSKQAKKGGILQGSNGEPSSLDSMAAPNSASTAEAANYVYSRLLKFKTGVIEPATGEIEGDLAESWEITPDKQTITFKLRDNAKYDKRPPTNGRTVQAKDVLYSLDRFKSLSTFRTELFRIDGSLGPIETVTAPDAKTVVMKLAAPDGLTLQLLTNPRYLYIQPTESDNNGYNLANDARGSGPWILKEWKASQSMEFTRNPDWHGNANGTRPYLDGVSQPFLTEYSALLAQFQAKNIWTGGFVRKEDIVRLKTENPSLILLDGGHTQAATRWFPGILPDSPFKDERVRQAVSMSLDRELIIDVFDNVQQLNSQGLPLEVRYHTSIACGWDGAWLDPKSSSFGPNAQYFTYNQAEAKKLMAAAGFANGFDFDFHYRGTGYGAAYDKWVEVLVGAQREVGIRAKQLPEEYNNVFLPGNRVEGKFTGARMIATSAQGDPVEMISNHYHSTGGFGVHQPPFTPEPDIDAMIDSMRKEFDIQKRQAIIHEFQRIMAKRQRVLLFPGATPSLSMSWPWVGNYGVFRTYSSIGGATESLPHYWYDESKKA